MSQTLYMVIEHVKDGTQHLCASFRDRGRVAPPGLSYVASWVDVSLERV